MVEELGCVRAAPRLLGRTRAAVLARWRVHVVDAGRAFIICTELHQPDAITVALVSRDARALVFRKISRKPLSFGEPVWFDGSAIGDEVLQLLSVREVEIDKDLAEGLQRVFGAGGEIEARRIA